MLRHNESYIFLMDLRLDFYESTEVKEVATGGVF